MMKNLTLLIKPASGLCNLRCSYCFYRAARGPEQSAVMSAETAGALIRKIRAYQPQSLNILFQGGEPTLAGLDFFRDFVGQVRRDIPVPAAFGLQSNGLLIDDAFAAFFRENRFLIGVSLDGDRRTNDRYRTDQNGAGVLPRILAGISALRKNRVDLNILSVVDDKNAAEIERTWAYFRKHDFRFLQFIPYVDEGGVTALSPEAYEFFLKRSFDLWYEEWEKGNYISVRHIDNYIRILMGDPPENCAMCGVCGSYFVVEADGSLYPCDFYCTDQYRLGSIFDEDPFAMKEKQRAFIARSTLIHPHCRSCRYYPLCRGGCLRDRTDNDTKNRYCEAYRSFFAHALPRMSQIAAALG